MGSSMVASACARVGGELQVRLRPSGRPLLARAVTRSVRAAAGAHPQCRDLDAAAIEARCGKRQRQVLRCPARWLRPMAWPLASVVRPLAKSTALPSSMPSLSQMTRRADASSNASAAGWQAGRRGRDRGRAAAALRPGVLTSRGIGGFEALRAESAVWRWQASPVAPARCAPSRISAMIVLALVPVLGGGPAVVDDQQQRRRRNRMRRGPAHRADGTRRMIRSGGNGEAQQHQPPRRLVGLFLAVDEIEQQADAAETSPSRAWAA